MEADEADEWGSQERVDRNDDRSIPVLAATVGTKH